MKHLNSILLLLITTCVGQAQNTSAKVDTIFVNEKGKTYVAVDYETDWADVGMPGYEATAVGKTIFLRALTLEEGFDAKKLPPAALIIKMDRKYMHLTIAYKSFLSSEEQFIDLRDEKIDDVPGLGNHERVSKQEIVSTIPKSVLTNLGILMGSDLDRFSLYADPSHKMVWKLTNVMQDEQHYYIKTTLYNKSKEDYRVDFVGFRYVNGEDYTDGEVIEKLYDEIVLARSTEDMVFAIRKMALGRQGELEVSIREVNGLRQLTFKCDYKIMLNAKTF